jgi:hypothetical protein
VRNILEAFRLSESGEGCGCLINCMEAAIAFYFLKPEAIRDAGIPLEEVM